MPQNISTPINLDGRKLMNQITFTVKVIVKRTFLVRVGLWLIRIGCYISGMNYEAT